MGNQVAKEFNDTFDEAKTFVERDVYAGKNTKISLGREYVDPETDESLFQIEYNKDSEADPTVVRSVASDADGYILYGDKVVVNEENNQKRVMIYKPSPVFPNQRAAKGMKMSKGDPNNVYLAAVIFQNQQGATARGAQLSYLCIVTGENPFDDTGFELQDLYKAMKNPNVKNGIIVADMDGRVAGKAFPTKRKRAPLLRSSSSSSCASTASMDSFQSLSNTSALSSSISSLLSSTRGEKKSTSFEISAGAEAAAVIAVATSFCN
jgi:hypothetical protein